MVGQPVFKNILESTSIIIPITIIVTIIML